LKWCNVGQVALDGLEGEGHEVGADLLEGVDGDARVSAVIDKFNVTLITVVVHLHNLRPVPLTVRLGRTDYTSCTSSNYIFMLGLAVFVFVLLLLLFFFFNPLAFGIIL
jgi:hypothetical protein